MSLWWAKKQQLDNSQLNLIENLPLDCDHLVTGPPGSGKTNILLRRAQFVKPQGMTRVMVLTFTRALTEFIRTGCLDANGSELFPRSSVSTYASWIKMLLKANGQPAPAVPGTNLLEDRDILASAALGLVANGKLPLFDVLFVDEAQDLIESEISLLREWSKFRFYVGDSRQHIFGGNDGIQVIRSISAPLSSHNLTFHYRMAPEICAVADRILTSQSGTPLANSEHYQGPRPGEVKPIGPANRQMQLKLLCDQLDLQLRAYGDTIRDGDKLGVVVARKEDRSIILNALDNDDRLVGKAQIVRARNFEEDSDYDPTMDVERPILILTAKACKGIEFRAAHWVFSDEGNYYLRDEDYYTVVTRAKTSLQIYFKTALPATLAMAYAPPVAPW